MYNSRSNGLWLCFLVALVGPLYSQPQKAQESGKSVNATTALSSRSHQEIARAKKLMAAGLNDQAIATLRRVLKGEPKNGDGHLLLGSALALAPERSEALKELRIAVELQPTSALARFTLGTAEARFGDVEAARQSLEKTLELDSTFAEAHVSLAMILAQHKELAPAHEHLIQAIHAYGNTESGAQAHYLLAQILLEENQPDKALEEVKKAISLRPNYAEAFVTRGFIRKWQHNDAAAITAFKHAVALSPQDFKAEHELGLAYLRAEEAAQAIGPLRHAAQLKPGDRTTLYQLCMALQKAGKQEEAKACQQGLSTKISAGLVTAANELAATEANNTGIELEKTGNLTGALEKYREAVRSDPSVTVFRRNMALALCRLDRWDEGIAELREVLNEDPDDSQATKALYIALENARAATSASVKAGQAHRDPK